jgi:hypothetical protein
MNSGISSPLCANTGKEVKAALVGNSPEITDSSAARKVTRSASLAKAGYQAIGLRVFRSPGITYPFYPIPDDPALARGVKKAIDDSGMSWLGSKSTP